MKLCIAVTALVLLPIPPLPAQDSPPRVESLGPGCCTLRVRSREGKAEGTYQGMPAPSRVVLSPCKGGLCPGPGASDSTIALSSNVQLEMYAGRSMAKGAIWGAVIGAVAFTAIWLGDQDLEQSAGGKIAVGIPVGGVVGAVAGGLVGSLFPRWTPVAR
jgi:hypothetical protein